MSDFRFPRLRPRDLLVLFNRLTHAGTKAARADRAERWKDSGSAAPALSAGGLSAAGVDSAFVGTMRAVSGPAVRREMPGVLGEMREAIDVFGDVGWLDDPLSYHSDPYLPVMRTGTFRASGQSWTTLEFDSGYEPHPEEPGRSRWLGYRDNRQAVVRMLRHPTPAPWVVLLHGSYMGNHRTDASIFHAAELHTQLGLNVLMPVLPLHGPRRERMGIVPRALPTLNALDNVHGLAQAAWDVRRLLSWIRQEDEFPITLYGISLGGYVAALTSALLQDRPVDRVIAGIPAVDFPSIFTSQMPDRAHTTDWFPQFAQDITTVHRPVSVLALPPPTVPRDHLHIYAARHDRVLKPLLQAARLWHHWDRPEILWLDGGHVTTSRTRRVTEFVQGRLAAG